MSSPVLFGSIILTPDWPFLIAEVGVNHENDLHRAFEFIERFADAGVDAIKFQSYRAETLASKHSPAYWDRAEEPTASQFELFKKYDAFGIAEYEQLARRCDDAGVIFMSTPFDSYYVDHLDSLMPIYKIASADITNFPLLKQIALKNKPIILSVGASTLAEMDIAVRYLQENGCDDIALLHCVLEYPTPPSHANLRAIKRLQDVFPDIVIGYSDHVPPHYNLLQLSAAWLMGARIIEKHVTLDKSKPGNDHYHAMDPEDLKQWRQQHQFLVESLGAGSLNFNIDESNARKFARRSIVTTRKLRAGDRLTSKDLITKRPGTGIAPQFLDLLIGCEVIVDIEEDTILQWDMVLNKQ